MEDTPALQGNETNMDTCTSICQGTFTSGSTTPSQHSMVSIHTHSGIVPQNSQQLEKESSNTVALPGFKHSADTTTHVETSRNVHSNGTLSTSLKTYTNTYANMDTNHTAHRDRDARKEVHLLSGPSELRSFKAMAHRHTKKEAHLLSRPSELQPTEHPETQKLDPAHVQQTRQEYSRLTEINKAKIFIVDSNWDLKAVVLIQVSYDQYKSFRATRASELHRASELQSFESRASNKGTKMLKTP